MVSDWVYEQHLRPLLACVSHYVGYRFGDADWTAIAQGLALRGSDESAYEYSLIGPDKRADVILRHEAGSSVVEFEIRADDELDLRIETAVTLLSLLVEA